MSIKMIIADDERFICEMIVKFVQTSEFDIDVIGVANSGKDLLRMINETSPDIVLTDIRMPDLSGLEVIQQARDHGCDCRFIVISGYREFEYAHAALKYTVSDYLLKPINKKELYLSLGKISKDLTGYSDKKYESSPLQERGIFEMLLNSKGNQAITLKNIRDRYGVFFSGNCYRLIFARIDVELNGGYVEESKSNFQQELINIVRQYEENICSQIVFDYSDNGLWALLNFESKDSDNVMIAVRELTRRACTVVELFNGISVTTFVSYESRYCKDLNDMREQIDNCDWLRYERGMERVIKCESVKPITIENSDKLAAITQEIKNAVDKLDGGNIAAAVRKLFSLQNSLLASPEGRRAVVTVCNYFVNTYSKILSEMDELDNASKAFTRVKYAAASLEQCGLLLEQSLESFAKMIQQNPSRRATYQIRQAMNYIERHYTENIHLEDVAASVKLNRVYLSSAFKKETGQNFSDYVIDCRINAAKEALKQSSMNISEVAYEVGYDDVQYFSRIFKKKVGLTPSEYRMIYS